MYSTIFLYTQGIAAAAIASMAEIPYWTARPETEVDIVQTQAQRREQTSEKSIL
jgi:hypothetical protein